MILRAILICVTVHALWAQPVDWYSKPLFPLSTATLTRAELAPILDAACSGKSYHQGEKLGCRSCPVGSADPTQSSGVEIHGVILGHFTSTIAEEAVLSTSGCEPHSHYWGGTLLLTRRDGKWRRLGYWSGVITDQCHSLPTGSGLDLLLCSKSYAGQGTHSRSLSLLTFPRAAPPIELASLGVANDMRACGQAGEGKQDDVRQSVIESVSFPDLDGDGIADVSILARTGKVHRTDAEFASCEQWSNGKLIWTPRVRVPAYRVEYLVGWDGVTVTPRSRNSAAALR